MSLFEKASRLRLRISTNVGRVSVEDLWDMSLEELDAVYAGLAKKIPSGATRLLSTDQASDNILNLKMDIVKHVFGVKQQEQAAAVMAADNKIRREEVLRALANKKSEELSGKSVEELEAMAEELK